MYQQNNFYIFKCRYKSIQILKCWYKIKGNGVEFMKTKKDKRIQIRISEKDREIIKRIANDRGYNNLSQYIFKLIMKDIAESEFINKQMIKVPDDWTQL